LAIEMLNSVMIKAGKKYLLIFPKMLLKFIFKTNIINFEMITTMNYLHNKNNFSLLADKLMDIIIGNLKQVLKTKIMQIRKL
jgi:hypothetical protein